MDIEYGKYGSWILRLDGNVEDSCHQATFAERDFGTWDLIGCENHLNT